MVLGTQEDTTDPRKSSRTSLPRQGDCSATAFPPRAKPTQTDATRLRLCFCTECIKKNSSGSLRWKAARKQRRKHRKSQMSQKTPGRVPGKRKTGSKRKTGRISRGKHDQRGETKSGSATGERESLFPRVATILRMRAPPKSSEHANTPQTQRRLLLFIYLQ